MVTLVLPSCIPQYFLYEVESFKGRTVSLEGSDTIVTQRPPTSEEISACKARIRDLNAKSIIVERNGIRIQCMPAGQFANSDEVIFAVLVSNSSSAPISALESSIALSHPFPISGERSRKPREVGFATGVGMDSPTVDPMSLILTGTTSPIIVKFEKERRKKPMKLEFTIQVANGTDYTYEFSFNGLQL